jgi:alpha-beta hydrolase superfamily lysophospholipase
LDDEGIWRTNVQLRTDSFQSSDGLSLFTQAWLPETPRALVIISHGYAEYSDRYHAFASYLVEKGFAVYALDHRGHGRSQGEKVNVKVFSEYVSDLSRFVEFVRQQHPNLKRFLLGHSMGGTIASQMVLEHPHQVDALILSAPYLKNAVAVPAALLAVSGIVSRLLPALPTIKLDVSAISRDPDIVEKYKTDPLVYNGGTKARFGFELLGAGDYVLTRAATIKLPILVMHGTADRIASIEGSQVLFNTVSSPDKTLKTFEGYYHEILNDVGKEKVYDEVLGWLEKHL